MILANLYVSVFMAPLFEQLSVWLLAFIVLVESGSLTLLSKTRFRPTLALVTAANVFSTFVGLLLLDLVPVSWDPWMFSDPPDTRPALLVFAGYLLCFVLSFLLEAGVYRVATLWFCPRLGWRAAAGANALSYALTPFFLWLYNWGWSLRYSGHNAPG